MQDKLIIKEANFKDFKKIWPIFNNVIQTCDTFVFPPEMSYGEANTYWMSSPNKVFIVCKNDEVLATYMLKPIHSGNGSHIANASFMVGEKARAKGIGKLMGLHCIQTAKKLGFKAIQYNMVVSTNSIAVNLWKSLGFKILATVPGGFKHKELGFVDSYIMFREL